MFAPGLDIGQEGKKQLYKEYSQGQLKKCDIDCGLDNISVSMLNLLILVIILL